MSLPKFTPSKTKLSSDSSAIKKRMNDLLCPVFVRNFNPYFNIIKGDAFYELFKDIEQNLYSLEKMLRSGQIDDHCQLITSVAKTLRLKCAQSFRKELKHQKTKKDFTHEFDENELILCYKCKELFPTTFFIAMRGNRLAKACFECRKMEKPNLYRKKCSKCVS